MTVRSAVVGRLGNGRPVYAHTLESDDGDLALTVLEVGASVDSVLVLDAMGDRRDVVLAPRDLDARLTGTAYLGSTVGRFANRLAGGAFELDGRTYAVPANEGAHALHGGPHGFDRRTWETVATTGSTVVMSLISPDGDQGFPGALSVQVTYTVLGRCVEVAYRATTTAATVVNLTNHAYFNLDGDASDGIDDHTLIVDADFYTPVTADLIPTGEVRSVTDSAFDFTGETRIGERVRRVDEQLRLARGVDHNFVVRGSGMRRHATLAGATSGIVLTVRSEQPGIQVYTGNMLDGSIIGRHGRTYRQGAGIALETQHFPDSPHQPDFPSTVLRPGDEATWTTVWDFGLR